MPQKDDLTSLFFPEEVVSFERQALNELIGEHMAMHEPQKLGSVLETFAAEANCSIGETLIHK